ncbi:HAD-like domain-containing protein [Rhexocercosporidium sp. MPI-PUGE-AT-0058]|nr:HAD-like domain-containing protein [Rhexocercosporidium sp. MPI-PUGE-AT-0058]
MRRCIPVAKNTLLRNDTASIASKLRCADQQFRPISAKKYYGCQRLSSPASPTSPRRPRHVLLPSAPYTAPRRSLNTEVIVDTDITPNGVPKFAFAFDIDGVLLRSSKPLPGASEALLYLQKNSIPFILLTNGGGTLESERVLQLSERLGVPLSEDNFIQSHTPFKQLVNRKNTASPEVLKDQVVLVTGGDGDKCRRAAESYGFKKVVTPGDILMACPDIWPFSKIFSQSYKDSCRPLPHPIDPTNPSNSLKIDAIFVFNDPRDWALDTQIIMDLLLSKQGVLGTVSEKNGNPTLINHGYQQDGQPTLYFSNPDLLWAAAYHIPRLGQGGFQAALAGVFTEVTGATLKRTVIGKPHLATYLYAEQVLWDYRNKLLGGFDKGENRLSRVFMVGDNPASDIKGANDANSQKEIAWTSILVKTGVFQEGTEPEYKPEIIVDNVLEAVKWALKEEGWKGTVDKVEG